MKLNLGSLMNYSKNLSMKAKVWTLREKPPTKPSLQHFACIEQDVPECKDGDVIIEAESISVDPYIRYRIAALPLNDSVIPGSQIAKVIASKNDSYPVGSYGLSYAGWRTHTLLKKEALESKAARELFMKLPDFGPIPKTLGLGTLGMPGITAYFGLLDICNPKENETVLVNGAAGAVGSVVCQIAKIKGCKVIAFAGSQEKVSWLKELGVDHAFNYKITKVNEALKKAAPKGINCYFDNIGGDFTAEAMPHMALGGRICVCGAISEYNEPNMWDPNRIVRNGPFNPIDIIRNQLRIEGIYVFHWMHRFPEGFTQLKKWIEEGKVKYRETITEGFDQTPSAFIGLFDGENIGKSIVKV